MANRLSNEELRKALQEWGEDVGPITPTTRTTWERRLVTLMKGKSPISRPKNHILNAFSSDDSEIENVASKISRKKRTHNRSNLGERSERMSLSHSRELNSSESEVFKKPAVIPLSPLSQEKRTHRTPNIGSRKTKKKNLTFDVETSDSDLDSESSFTRSPSTRRKPLTSNFSSDFQGVSLRHLNNKEPRYSGSIFERKPLNTSWTPKLDQSLLNVTPLLEPDSIARYRREQGSLPYQANGYLSSAMTNGDYSDEKVSQSSSTVTNYSHCVSWLLLLGAVVFFVAIGVVYMTEVQKTNQLTDKSSFSQFCTAEIGKVHCESYISMCREVHSVLTTVAGDFECGSLKSRNLTVPVLRDTMKELLSVDRNFKMEQFEFLFTQSILLFMKTPELGIKWHSVSTDEKQGGVGHRLSLKDLSALEAIQAAKSFWCRVQLSFAWTITKLLLLLLVGFLLFVSYLFGTFLKKRKEAQEKIFYEMVESVIDILQDTSDSLQQMDYLPGTCKAVVNVRDALIPAKERKGKLWLWDRVVAFIEENESRVSVEYRKINGEDFKVWRWNSATTTEGEGSKLGKVWQGQAFSSLGKGKNAVYTPSPCLKIRNMFDPEVEYGDDWQVSVRDAILEKCEGNDGIRHIAFDTSTNNEGCVFMMCSSSEAAGKAYNDLHGWWFDGKLVTVKYLKLARYLERFPAAEGSTDSLRPSNNKRLSLSTPFFSSALERS